MNNEKQVDPYLEFSDVALNESLDLPTRYMLTAWTEGQTRAEIWYQIPAVNVAVIPGYRKEHEFGQCDAQFDGSRTDFPPEGTHALLGVIRAPNKVCERNYLGHDTKFLGELRRELQAKRWAPNSEADHMLWCKGLLGADRDATMIVGDAVLLVNNTAKRLYMVDWAGFKLIDKENC